MGFFKLFFTIYLLDIDPDDESTESYGRDIFNYVTIRDAKYIVTSNDIISKEDPKARLYVFTELIKPSNLLVRFKVSTFWDEHKIGKKNPQKDISKLTDLYRKKVWFWTVKINRNWIGKSG